jgi:hypothetical protein
LVTDIQHFHASLLDVRQRDSNVATGKRVVHRAIRQLEGVRGAIMAIDALHIVFRQSLCGIRRRIGTGESLDFSGFCVCVFDPRDRLPCRVRYGETDVNPWAQVSTVNAPDLVPSHPHHEHRLRAGVGFVFSLFVDHTQSYATELLRPMAILAGLFGGYEAIAF